MAKKNFSIDCFSVFALAAILLLTGCQHNQSDSIRVAYQTGVDPSKVPQAQGEYENAIHHKMDWHRFNNGSEVVNAIASGDIDIGNIGSSPLALAISRKLPIKVFLIASEIQQSEALVVKNNITSPISLIHKKIATPFVSTSHYSLLGALKHWNINTKDVQLVNLTPSEINAAWQRNDIDGAFVWSPALAEIEKTGNVLTTAEQVGSWGKPTFQVWVVRDEFAKQHPDWVRQFARTTLHAYQDYHDHKKTWTADSQPVQAIARLTGVNPVDVPKLLEGANFPLRQEQISSQLVGGWTAVAIADTSAFLKEQGLIQQTVDDYQSYIDGQYVTELETTQNEAPRIVIGRQF